MIAVEIDTAEIERGWERVVRELSEGVLRGVTLGLREGAAEARRTTLFKDHTGELRNSIDGILGGRASVGAGGGAAGEFVALAKYASFVAEGTKPHTIYPKDRVALRWFSAGGQVHFASHVNHPGTAPINFMERATEKFQEVVEREVDVACVRAERAFDR